MPEDDLLEALRGLGADHEPDTLAIRRRMEARPKVVPLRQRPATVPRRRPVLLSAAAAILIGGGVTVATSQMSPASSATSSDPLPVDIQPFATPSTSTDPTGTKTSTAPSPSTTTKSSPSSTTTTSTHSDTSSKATTTKAGSTSAAVSGSVTAINADNQIALSDTDDDWLAIGSRNDMKTIQKKAALDAPLLEFAAPDSAVSVDGPLLLSWSGGAPEQSREDTPRWMESGEAVTVTADSTARTVTLYVGSGLKVSYSGEGLDGGSVSVGDDAAGHAVTLKIPAHSGATTITLSGSGSVQLMAVTADAD